MAAFTDDMLCAYRPGDPLFLGSDMADDEEFVEYSLRGAGRVIAERLDLLGFSRQTTMGYLDQLLEQERESTARLEGVGGCESREGESPDGDTASGWIAQASLLAREPVTAAGFSRAMPESLKLLDDVVPSLALRAALLAMPDAEVIFMLGQDAVEDGELAGLCAGALERLQEEAAAHAPVVVLTEGHSDVAILQPSLALLYPHLTDLVRFMDYSNSPRGGAGPLVGTVRAFAAAGIVNPVVALFYNDTAACDALRPLDRTALPGNIKVLQYPPLPLASHYPTLGPPTAEAPTGHLAFADVNGTAGSIELYLGRDVLTLPDGTLHPVQWRSYIEGSKQYQGEITGKKELQVAFQEKLARAQTDPSALGTQDWDGIRAILDSILQSGF